MLYAAHASPLEVTRIAVRYINQIKLSLPPDQLGDFLTAPPQLPPDTPVEIDGFLTRFAVRERGSSVAATIIQASKGRQGKDHLAVLLDIDAFERGSFACDEATLTAHLGHLRELKNRIFFRSITDRAKAMFQ